MELQYTHAESTVKPQSLEMGVTTVYLRKDIREVKRKNEQDGSMQTYWSYDEAQMSTEEFNANANAILVDEQKASTDSQLTIMEAIADLYDVIAMMQV